MSDMTENDKTKNAVQELFQLFADGWKTNDGATLARFFVEDGALINPFGQRADGRSAIGAMYSEYFEGMLQGTSTTFKLESVRAVEASHAFADGEQTISAASGEVVLVAHLAALLRRDGGSWRFVESRPYTFPATPA